MKQTITLSVQGIKCGGCVGKIERALAKDGVIKVTASIVENSVQVEFESGRIDGETIAGLVVDAGYQVEV